METIALVFPDASVTLESLAAALANCGDVALNDKVITVRFDASRVYIVADVMSHLEDIFEEWPGHLVPSGPVVIFSLDYRNKEDAVEVISALAQLFPVIIDSNFGYVGPGLGFTVKMLDHRK
ncbi:hypothetical protein [Kitasatospora sp. NPDC059327]|uniref:hypothetical protein n=1 Tax=Kitasatospora sp. NPDC059327 TaxID=3346803 RepID=UPI0036CA887F